MELPNLFPIKYFKMYLVMFDLPKVQYHTIFFCQNIFVTSDEICNFPNNLPNIHWFPEQYRVIQYHDISTLTLLRSYLDQSPM